jgi:hypothetical protein
MRSIVNSKIIPDGSPLRTRSSPNSADFMLALFDAVGRYCSFCEKPLANSGHLFHKKRGVVAFILALKDWSDLLLICEDCSGNMCIFDPTRKYLWPDEYQTYVPSNPDTPYIYTSKSTKVVLTADDNPQQVLRTEQRDFVFVTPNPRSPVGEQAGNMIELFKLNGAFFNNALDRPEIVIPASRQAQALDGRLEGRALALRRAFRAAQKFEIAKKTSGLASGVFYESAIEYLEDMLPAVGYWSTWVATFWEIFQNRDLLTRLFLQTAQSTQTRSGKKRYWTEIYPDIRDDLPPIILPVTK